MIWMIVLYIIGLPFCYLMFKKEYQGVSKEWNTADRILGLTFCLTSWPGLLICLWSMWMQSIDERDKPASW